MRKTALFRSPLLLAAGALAFVSGCVTTSHPFALPKIDAPAKADPAPAASTVRSKPASAPVLTLGQEIDWVFENAPEQPGVVRVGRSQVGPDGTIVVGPYGTCKVAGLTEVAAARKVEGLLREQFKTPKVRVEMTPTPAVTLGSAWRKPGPGDVVRAHKDPETPELLGPPLGPDDKAEVAPFPAEAPAFPVGHRLHGKATPLAGFAVHSAPSELNPTLLPPYVIGPPDVLLVQSRHALITHPVQGQHLVRPDGSIGLSIYGSPIVAGATLEMAKDVIARTISPKLKLPKDTDEKTGKVISYYEPEEQLKVVREGLVVDVLAYNSKVYYVITDGGGYGEQVVRLPITGGETVLDALSQVNGLSPVSSKHHVWVARRAPGHGGPESVLRVDWIGITQRGATATNYQIMPGDRLYVRADRWRAADALVAKVLAPFERILGVTLLGSQTVNSFRNSGSNSNNR